MGFFPLMSDNLKDRLCPPTALAGWTFGERDLEEAIRGDRLLCPSLDLSPACNLDCPYCFQVDEHKGARPKTLALDTVKTLVTAMAKAGARTINIVGAGEPLLDHRFEEVARFIDSTGVHLLVATNGVALTRRPSLLRTLMDIEASVVLKMNSRRPEVEDAMVGRPGYALQRDRALELLLEAGFADCRPTRLAVNTVITAVNEGEIIDMHRFCRARNICFIAGTYMPTGRTDVGSAVSDDTLLAPLPAERLAAITARIRELDGAAATRGDLPAYASDLPCVQALGLYVDFEGKVWHCPTKKRLRKGRLVAEPLAEIETGPSFSEIWAEHPYIADFRRNYSGGCPYKVAALGRGSDDE